MGKLNIKDKNQTRSWGYKGESMFNEKQVLDLKESGIYKLKKDYETVSFNEETIRSIFGHEAAEDEDLMRLKRYYVKTEIFNSMKSSIPLYILVGHKGVGKSALIKVLSSEDKDDNNIPIIIQPDDILDIDVDTSNFLQRIRDWKEGLSKIILKELLYSVNEYTLKKIENPNMKKWMDSLLKLIESVFGKQIQELQNNYIDLTNEQITSFFKNNLFKEKVVTIYLDDLDRGWKNSKADVENLSAMLNAVRDLARDTSNLRFRVGLRSDVYYAIRTSDETTDKIDGSVLWLKWTNHEILVMLIKRIETYFENTFDEKELLKTNQSDFQPILDRIFEERFKGKGHWENAPMHRVLMSLIRKRPRDLVKLCTLAARRAYLLGHNKIMTSDLEYVFANYSNDRLTDTGNEYQSEFPMVKELLLKMKPSQKELLNGRACKFTRGELIKKLQDVISMSHFAFKDNKNISPSTLAAFLYKINFITARKKTSQGIERIYYDENQYIYNDFADFGYEYEIHPAFRWALQPTNINSLFKQIELSE